MAIKRNREAFRDGESTSEASQDRKRTRVSVDSDDEHPEQPEPPLTQDDNVSEIEDNEDVIEQEEPDQEEEDRFERENAEKLALSPLV